MFSPEIQISKRYLHGLTLTFGISTVPPYKKKVVIQVQTVIFQSSILERQESIKTMSPGGFSRPNDVKLE